MEKVLIYSNRKTEAHVWNVSTPEKRAKAFLSLFKLLDETWDCYVDLEYDPGDQDPHEVQLFKSAKEGDAKAAEQLLAGRLDSEYEYWTVTNVE